MTEKIQVGEMRLIQTDLIDILNPRERNKKVFDDIVTNINTIGCQTDYALTISIFHLLLKYGN